MPHLSTVFLLGFTFISSAALTGLVRYQAKRRKWLAIPNERSSHRHPTPRGGGLAIAAAFFMAVLALQMNSEIPDTMVLALLGGGLLVTIVSWVDDRRGVHVGARLVVQFVAAGWALFFIGQLQSLDVGFTRLPLGFLSAFIPLGMVWVMNMYNFMDGVDGLAGSETVVVSAAAGAFLGASGAWDLAILSWSLGAACAGFLVWNWPPAKIFMGDVGSVLVGFIFSVLAVASEETASLPALVWLLLLMVFVVDATLTTLRRFLKGEQWFAGHHEFAFQQLFKQGVSHRTITIGVMLIDCLLIVAAMISITTPALLLPIIALSAGALSLGWWNIQRNATNARVGS